MRIELTLDCTDRETTAAFWQAAVGHERDGVIENRFVSLTGDGPGLTLQRLAEPRAAKNRMHLDLLVADVAAEVRRLEALGATRQAPGAREESGQTWSVLADPEGNESASPGISVMSRDELIALALGLPGAVEDVHVHGSGVWGNRY
jgi:Glyoxalase-like domain